MIVNSESVTLLPGGSILLEVSEIDGQLTGSKESFSLLWDFEISQNVTNGTYASTAEVSVSITDVSESGAQYELILEDDTSSVMITIAVQSLTDIDSVDTVFGKLKAIDDNNRIMYQNLMNQIRVTQGLIIATLATSVAQIIVAVRSASVGRVNRIG